MELKIIAQVPESELVHGEDIVAIIWNSGKLLTAINTKDNKGIIKVWNGDLQLLTEVLAHEFPIFHMTSGQGSEFFTSCSDATINHWENVNGRVVLLDILRGHVEPATRLRFVGNRLYSGDYAGEVRMWEDGELVGCLGTVEEIWEMMIHENVLFTARHLDVYMTTLKCHAISEPIIWSIRNTIPGSGPFLISDNKLCMMSRSTYEVLVHSLMETGNPLLGKLTGHEAIVMSMVEDAKNKTLFTGGYDKKVIAWDLDTLKFIVEIKLDGNIYSMVYDSLKSDLYVGGENRFLCKLKLE